MNNQFNFTEIKVLDLFSGTGNMSFEFASRGCTDITAVEKDRNCNIYISKTAEELGIDSIEIEQDDVFAFVRNCSDRYDLIFADPPYTLPNPSELVELIFENNLLKDNGRLILEHQPKISFDNHPRFIQQRKYGSSIFSIFRSS